MAIISITTTAGAVSPEARPHIAKEIAALTSVAEGFAGSAIAPELCWTFFNDRPHGAFSTGAGEPPHPLYYVEITILRGAIDRSAKESLGAAITSALLSREIAPPIPRQPGRVWVRYSEVSDGDLIVGGRATSLAGLRAFVAGEQ